MAEVTFDDDDGEARRDWSNGEATRDPAALTLEEMILPVGAFASASGHWSAERRALTAGGAGSVAAWVEVTLGHRTSRPRSPAPCRPRSEAIS